MLSWKQSALLVIIKMTSFVATHDARLHIPGTNEPTSAQQAKQGG